ncbi:MAG: hypothetical protein ONB48_05785 [candidate division KSB1 bacterium]|nr:hypothetical protein [candidate division KSB1 bacterium]MDZ7298194.1 hypothetical protein [candidate division KSB1 bacterium]MDZ7349173.1 hypothetical protein [candidate division KSB1 bacterium]MDZ7380869.1 hypothetical protein [candidate division KSB1 bacterium]MDZ7396176.1 hypothetical protein [candidate division KSB1 bacterium]
MRYEEKLKFYLDQKTRDYLVETAAQERLLLESIKNLYAEVKQRGLEGIAKDQPGFQQIYGEMDRMVQDYTAELEAILAMLDEIHALTRTLRLENRSDLLEQFSDLRDRLLTVIENRELHKKNVATTGYKAGLVREYDVEVDSVLRMFDRLERFERTARARGDSSALQLVRQQKQKIQGIVARVYDVTHEEPAIAHAYLKEVDQLTKVLQQLDKLEQARAATLPAALDVEAERRQVLSRLDKGLITLLGYTPHPDSATITLEQAFQEWRAGRHTAFEVKRAQYAILKRNLLQTADTRAFLRMLNRDLSDALLNYAAERYLLADLQFQTAMQDYGPHFARYGLTPNWEAVVFYRAESLYGRGIYPEAFKVYEQLLREHAANKFRGTALLRLLSMAHTLKWEKPFFFYYRQMDSLAASLDPKLLARGRYLAGYYHLTCERFHEADAELAKIPESSKYNLAARYLRGVAQVNLGNPAAAYPHFDAVASAPALPWSDAFNTLLRNNALLKLGFIFYERGDYAGAGRYFEQVSKGSEHYDQSLLGLAWAEMKQGNLEGSLTHTGALLGNYLASNYVYEALALSAHCKRLLERPELAMKDFRYVTNARGVLEVTQEYNEERRRIVAQLAELEQMEKQVLERQDRSLYELIALAKQEVQALLLNFNYRGPRGNLLSDEFADERQNLYAQIRYFDRVIAEAERAGLPEVAQEAVQRRNRILRALEVYQADRALQAVNYWVEYPLAIKESGALYRKQIVDSLLVEMEAEQNRLQESLTHFQELMSKHARDTTSIVTRFEILQQDLTNLKYRMDRFQTWLSDYQVDTVASDFDQWADFSGFGLSDLTFQELERREQKIEQQAANIAAIDQLLRDRQASLQARLKRFDEEMRRIEAELLEEQVRLDKLEHQKYFDYFYFDTSGTEIPAEQQAKTAPAPDKGTQ